MRKIELVFFFCPHWWLLCHTGKVRTLSIPSQEVPMCSSPLSAGRTADQGVLRLHDEGWPHLRCRGYLRKRGLPCPCHSPGHQVTSLLTGERAQPLPLGESHREEGLVASGWAPSSRPELGTQRLNGVLRKELVVE